MTVAVIGAGIAGTCAARDLSRAGYSVRLFEKARGVGGRTSTRRSGEARFDHGAQYFTARTASFARQVDEWCARRIAERWPVALATCARGVLEPLEDAGERDRFVGVPGMSALAKDLAAGLPLDTATRVERVERTGGVWQLQLEDGTGQGGFEALVVAAPAPQAAPLLAAAPGFAALAAEVDMLPCQAVMVGFANRLAVVPDGLFLEDSPLAWAARNAAKPGRPDGESWVLHASPAWSAAHLEDAPDRISQALLAAFGTAMPFALPDVISASSHRWRFARTAAPVGRPCLWDESLQLGACGDWLLGERVEDAFTSGAALAAAIVEARALR